MMARASAVTISRAAELSARTSRPLPSLFPRWNISGSDCEAERYIPAVLSGRLTEGRYGRRLHTGRRWKKSKAILSKEKSNTTLAPEMRSPARNNAVDDTHVLSLPDFAILIPVMIGEIVTRSIDGASLVDTDDTNSMGAQHRDDTKGV